MPPSEHVLPFSEFMRIALHDPERGYYARRIRGVGTKGDFTTVPMVTEALASAVAAWISRESRRTGIRDIVELGPGEGVLMGAVLARIPFWYRRKFRVHLVETSEVLRKIQQSVLGKGSRWHNHPSGAMAASGGRALVYSNELVDAFPVRRFEKTANGWRELGVRMVGESVVGEVLLDVDHLPESSVFSHDHPVGQRVEVHESYHRWLASWLGDWQEGAMLTIDYGAEVGQLNRRRPHGTLRAFLLHQRLEGPEIYQNVGRQDLTADVNFTDLVEWGRPWLDPSPLQTLGEFCGSAVPSWMGEESGAGDAFLVLEQTRRPAR